MDELIAPWAAIATDWMEPPRLERAQCPESDPGNLILSPAPGEQFDLTIQLADQLLNYVFDTIFVEMDFNFTGSPPGALVQFNGLQYGIGDR